MTKLVAIQIGPDSKESILVAKTSTCENCKHWSGSYRDKGHCGNTRSHAFYSGQFALSSEFCSEWEPHQ